MTTHCVTRHEISSKSFFDILMLLIQNTVTDMTSYSELCDVRVEIQRTAETN